MAARYCVHVYGSHSNPPLISFMYYDDLEKARRHAKVVEANGREWQIFEGATPLEGRVTDDKADSGTAGGK